MAAKKPIAVSGIQASGNIHIGNYIGAIKQFIELQNTYKLYVFIADLHAITVPQNPRKLREQILSAAAIYLACGLDPEKTTIFTQSHIPAHAELGWILNTITPLGELERMTQFKEKRNKQGVLGGILNYPTLMAADILLYKADVVPVGEDQLQHLELTRTLARRFNSRFGKTLVEPKALLQKEGARIAALNDPAKKMSKSASSPNNYIGLLDSPSEIRRKLKIAVTDSEKEVRFDPEKKPGISNLLVIASQMSGRSVMAFEAEYKDKGYGEFKHDVGEILVEKLEPIQERYKDLAAHRNNLLKILEQGAAEAHALASDTLAKVKETIGLI
jgi:tryptophanyl-tRNA synthetase